MLYKEFYSELGKLLYAVADIEGVISPKEKKALHDIVIKELISMEKDNDEFGTNIAYYTEMEFDYLDDNILDVESTFNSFIDFIEEHYTAFDKKMKKVCIHVANELAAAYYGTNKKEKILIERLKKNLNKINFETVKNKIPQKI